MAHPRNENSPAGSSPLTRGTQLNPVQRIRLRRFIPAYAGNTSLGLPRSGGVAVHPRLRGEHVAGALHVLEVGGSSPLTRGTRPSNQATTEF